MSEINIKSLSDPVFSYLYELFWIFLDFLCSKIDLSFFWNFYSQQDLSTIFWTHLGIVLNINYITNAGRRHFQDSIRKLFSKKNLENVFKEIICLAGTCLRKCCETIIIFFEFLWFELNNLRNKTDNFEITVTQPTKNHRPSTHKKGIFLSNTKFLNYVS